MVYKFAKIIIVLIPSFAISYFITPFISDFAASKMSLDNDSWGSVFLMVNYTFGWLIYAAPFAIIGFKIYPKQKTKK